MLIVISPAKSLDFESPVRISNHSMPEMLNESHVLIEKLQKLTPRKISQLMGISEKLGKLNYERFQTWQPEFSLENARQSVLAFSGDVYQGLNATTLSEAQLEYAQNHLRILSGLYGILKPLDLMLPYRLEMGTKLTVGRKKNLYEFWGNKITDKVNSAVTESGSEYLINLASNEYFKSINLKKIKAPVITPEFKELKNGSYKIVSFFAKKARGLMSRFIIENEISDPENLKAFDYEGYNFNPRLGSENKLVFTREN